MTVRKIVIRFCNNIRHFSNEINKPGGGIFFCGGWNFSKSVSVDSTFIREMRVNNSLELIVLIYILWRKPKMSGRKYAAFLAATARFLRFLKGNWP